jgi:hypothetical protein
MPVQLTLRSPKGGRVLAERTYDDGLRIDATGGWLAVVDRNGSVIALHAATPGLEGAVVEYASAAARSFADEVASIEQHAAPPLRVADLTVPGQPIDNNLLDRLHALGRTYGPLGVAIAAATLTDLDALVRRLTEPEGDSVPKPADDLVSFDPDGDGPPNVVVDLDAEDPVDHTHDGCEANLDALRAEVARLTANLDAQDQLNRRLIAEHRSEVDELRTTLDLYRRRYGRHPEQPDRPATIGEALADAAPTITAERPRRRWITLPGTVADPGERHHFHDDTVPHEPIDLRPLEEDPRRPSLDAWPDDAVLLTYAELRRLVSLHLERYNADEGAARAVLEGDVPLRVSEVLDR